MDYVETNQIIREISHFVDDLTSITISLVNRYFITQFGEIGFITACFQTVT